MSYSISFMVKVEGVDAWVEVEDCDANTTWNVREMIEKSTGLPWLNCQNNGLCSEVVPKIEHGLHELENNRMEYIQYEAKNGWGTVETTKRFFRDILQAWRELQEDEPELAKVATFWIC